MLYHTIPLMLMQLWKVDLWPNVQWPQALWTDSVPISEMAHSQPVLPISISSQPTTVTFYT